MIPNPVNVAALRRQQAPRSGPYALYAGKLAANKGTDLLVDAIDRAGLDCPVVIVGDGPDAAMLIFPSRGPESLSRVLIEASALGVPIAAMHRRQRTSASERSERATGAERAAKRAPASDGVGESEGQSPSAPI